MSNRGIILIKYFSTQAEMLAYFFMQRRIDMYTLKQAAMQCGRSEKEINIIFENYIMYNGEIIETFENMFEKQGNIYYVKDECLDQFKNLLRGFARLLHTDDTTILGYTLTTYTDNCQLYYDIEEICEKFNFDGVEFHKYVNFYDVTKALIINGALDDKPIHNLVTEHGVYLLIYLYMAALLDGENKK